MSICHFLSEILGRKLTCYTDQMAIVDAMKRPQLQQNDPQATRQLLEVSQFTTDIQHISRSKNVTTDFLTRCTYEKLKPPTLDQVYQSFEPLMTEDEKAGLNSSKITQIDTPMGPGLINVSELTESVKIDMIDLNELAREQKNSEEIQKSSLC